MVKSGCDERKRLGMDILARVCGSKVRGEGDALHRPVTTATVFPPRVFARRNRLVGMVPYSSHDGERLGAALQRKEECWPSMTISKSGHAHVIGQTDHCVFGPIQVEVIALARVVADGADLLVRRRSIAV